MLDIPLVPIRAYISKVAVQGNGAYAFAH